MMKHTILLLIILSTFSFAGLAENYHPIRLEVGIECNMGFKVGVGAFGILLEPKINIHDNVAIGIRYAFLDNGEWLPTSESHVILAKADYFLTLDKIRPFASFGIGLYAGFGSTPTYEGIYQYRGGSNFGFMPQAGVNLGVFRVALGGHFFISERLVSPTPLSGEQDEYEAVLRGLLSIEMSWSIAGKKKSITDEN